MEHAAHHWRPLGQLLVEQGVLTETQLERALEEQRRTGGRLGSVLVELELVTSHALERVLMEQMGFDLSRQSGFGSGLRAELERRGSRSARPLVRLELVATPEPEASPEPEPSVEPAPPRSDPVDESAAGVEAGADAQPRMSETREETPGPFRARRRDRSAARATARLRKALEEFDRATDALQSDLSVVRDALAASR